MKKRDKVYKHIYSFEANPFNFERAAKNLLGYNNIDLIHCGISSKRIDLKFICSYETNGLKSHITSDDVDTIIVPMTSLNLFFADKQINERPTIIKINIGEGEKEALIRLCFNKRWCLANLNYICQTSFCETLIVGFEMVI